MKLSARPTVVTLLRASLLASLCACATPPVAEDGWELMERTEYREALAHFDRALRMEATGDNHAGRGRALLALGEAQGACEAYEAAVQLEPRVADWHHGLALSRLGEGELGASLRAFDEALLLEPESAALHYNRGFVHDLLGDTESAWLDFSKAAELDGTYAQAYNARGVVAARAGRTDEALADFERAWRLDPTLVSALGNQAAAHQARGETQRALVLLNKAVKLERKNPLFLINRGKLLADLGLDEDALADFEAARALAPHEPAVAELVADARTTLEESAP